MRVLALALVLAASVAPGGNAAYAGAGELAPEHPQTGLPAGKLDQQLNAALADMIASAEIGPGGEVLFNRSLGDRRFLEANSGRYWQISGAGHVAFRSRSLWDRTLEASGRKAWAEPLTYDSDQFPGERLRIAERTVRLPGSDVEWQFMVAESRVGEANR